MHFRDIFAWIKTLIQFPPFHFSTLVLSVFGVQLIADIISLHCDVKLHVLGKNNDILKDVFFKFFFSENRL